MPASLDMRPSNATTKAKELLSGPFFWLSAFYLVYCIRLEDWIPGLTYVPLAKISGVCAMVGLFLSLGRSKRGLRDVPSEGRYLLAMIGLLYVSALLSPVWRGGALVQTLDFSKVFVAWILTFLLVTSVGRLRRIIFIQVASVAVVSLISLLRSGSHPRLEGAFGGIYSNPNDLAFAIVLSLPFCLAFLLSTKNLLRRVAWMVAMLFSATALVLTASRAGFITLVISGAVCLWHFAIKGRRPQLIVATVLIGVTLLAVAGKTLKDRFLAISGEDLDTRVEGTAYGSFEDRERLIFRALHGIEQYPVLGVGKNNFVTYSEVWREVHVSYLQIAVEGGIPALILYLMFFSRGFTNLRQVRRFKLDAETQLLAGGLHSSLVGFAVGALFAPEAYQFFPYFAVAFTSALLATLREQEAGSLKPGKLSDRMSPWQRGNGENYKSPRETLRTPSVVR